MKLFEIGPKIKELRKGKGITQARLAEIAGISRVTLGKLERSEIASISIGTLDMILNALEYEIDIKSNFSRSFGLLSLDEMV